MAREYRGRLCDELTGKPLDRALLAALVEQAVPGAPVADLGCGPGHVAAWLAGRGVSAVGIDLSPGMVAVAREAYPQVEFREGDLVRLPAADGEFGAAVALYSLIHLAPQELSPALVEARRVLRPGAPLLLAVHLGDEVRHLAEWWGHAVDVDFRFVEADVLLAAVTAAGLVVQARLERTSYPHEVETRRLYVLARNPG
ncbi:class I SAM-dependent methyltransferase [Micromonospora sp. NPDC003776]